MFVENVVQFVRSLDDETKDRNHVSCHIFMMSKWASEFTFTFILIDMDLLVSNGSPFKERENYELVQLKGMWMSSICICISFFLSSASGLSPDSCTVHIVSVCLDSPVYKPFQYGYQQE